MNRQVPKINLFAVIMNAEFGYNLLPPVFVFIFFATNSPLFDPSVGNVQRSLLFGICLSLNKLGEVLANVVITTLSDFFGRKIALYATVIGLLIAGAGGVTAMLLHNPWIMILSLFFSSSLNTNKAIGPAIMGDISAIHNRISYMAAVQCIISLGACVGPIVGGQLANHALILPIAYSAPFLLIVIIAACSLWLTRFCPETLTLAKQKPIIPIKKIIKDYRSILQNNSVRWLFLLLVLCQITWSTYYEFIPPTLKNIFHFTAPQVGWFVGIIAFWLVVATSVVIRLLLRRFNESQLLWFSATAILTGALFALIASESPMLAWSQPLLWFSAVPTAMGDVIFFSLFTTFLSRYTPPDQQGKAMGLTLIIASGVWSITALIGGYLITLRPNGALWFAPCGAIGLILLLWWFKKKIEHASVLGA